MRLLDRAILAEFPLVTIPRLETAIIRFEQSHDTAQPRGMTMPVRTTRLFSLLTAVLAFGLLPQAAFSQTVGGRTALAAKQRLKTEVQDAMTDGKIGKLERSEILAAGREILTVKEYEGLKATLDRLSPLTPASEPKRPGVERAIASSMRDRAESPTILDRMISRVPYIEDMSFGPRPKVVEIVKSIPYSKPREIDVSGAKEALAKVPRLSETYIDPPTAERPLPKITRVERTAASGRWSADRNLSRRNAAVEKRPNSRYADESIVPLPPTIDRDEPNVARRPNKASEATDPLAGSPSNERGSTGPTTPAGAILSDQSAPAANAEYYRPAQPAGLESEFLR
ncbi:MAG: hypothetical protein IT426_08970 [Pirellulales bacterium]|nr:hypothetical protein [Pirellulales bacterium]